MAEAIHPIRIIRDPQKRLESLGHARDCIVALIERDFPKNAEAVGEALAGPNPERMLENAVMLIDSLATFAASSIRTSAARDERPGEDEQNREVLEVLALSVALKRRLEARSMG